MTLAINVPTIALSQQTQTLVLLVEPNAALRSAILTLLAAEEYEVEACDDLGQALSRSADRTRVVALVAWQSMDGLLAEEHRERLNELTERLRLVLMVPRRWARLLEQTDVIDTLAGLIAKPFQADELLNTLQRAVDSVPASRSSATMRASSPER